jgi:hypothetical protein
MPIASAIGARDDRHIPLALSPPLLDLPADEAPM